MRTRHGHNAVRGGGDAVGDQFVGGLGAVRVLDENSRRRRVGLIAQGDGDDAQPLLSPLHYISRALAPFADLIEPTSADLGSAIPQLLEQRPAMIVMADVGTLPDEAHAALVEWVEGGGTLVRFAGPRLAAGPVPFAFSKAAPFILKQYFTVRINQIA